jgi:UDP-N-acetylmuramate dehydrogenase
MTIRQDFEIKNILWYHIGGTVKYLLEVSSQSDLVEAVEFIKAREIKKVFVAATGANLLFTDDYFDGAVIHLVTPEEFDIDIVHETHVKTFAGVMLDHIIQFGFEQHLTGLEWAGGLPGTVGAGVRGNVGAFGGEIKDIFESAEILDITDPELTFETYTAERMEFEYRGSIVKHKKNLIISSVTLRLKKSSEEETDQARNVYQEHIDYRFKHHPMDSFNTGSVFKNIEEKDKIEKVIAAIPELKEKVETSWHGKVSAGFLITHMGLRGKQIGQAQVSEKHANFINNLGDAKFTDVTALIELIQNMCEEQFGFRLEPEVEIVQ